MDVLTKTMSLAILKRNSLNIEKAEECARKLMNKKKYIEMDEKEYEKVWNEKVDEFIIKNDNKRIKKFYKKEELKEVYLVCN